MSVPDPRPTDQPGDPSVPADSQTRGAVALEYGLLAAVVALVALAGIVALGDSLAALPLQSLIDAFVDALS